MPISMPSLCLSLCLLYPITMPMPFSMPISMPSLSHHYAFPMPSLSHHYAYAFLYHYYAYLYPITMPMPIIAMPSLSHHYAYAYHYYAFSIPSLCLCLSLLCLSLSDHYAYAYHRYAFSIPSLCLCLSLLCLSLSDHYAYAYHRYAFSIPSLCLCLSSLSLSISKETLEPLQSTLHLWGAVGFFLALIRWKIIIISRGTRRKKITASFWFFWRREMLFHIHQLRQFLPLPYYWPPLFPSVLGFLDRLCKKSPDQFAQLGSHVPLRWEQPTYIVGNVNSVSVREDAIPFGSPGPTWSLPTSKLSG